MTPAALKRLIQRRLDAIPEVEEDGERIFAREVRPHATDDDGRNWDMSGYNGPAGYGAEVRLAVERLRREYLLGEEPIRW